MNQEILFKIDDINTLKSKYRGKVWDYGYELFNEGAVLDAFAVNDNVACFTVSGTINYTVIVQKHNDGIKIDCNCPYFGECKHEVAVLCYLNENPLLRVENRQISMEISDLDKFKLEVEEQLYEMDNEEDYDTAALEDSLQFLYRKILETDVIETRIAMIFYLSRKFPTGDEIWKFLIESFRQDPKAVIYTITKMRNDLTRIMIDEVITAIEEENEDIYEDLILCLREIKIEHDS